MKAIKNKRILGIIFASFILINNILNCTTVKAGTWGMIDDLTKHVEGDNITWIQIHHAGDKDKVRYSTYKYSVSKEKYDLNTPFTEGANEAIKKSFITVFASADQEGEDKTVTYTISMRDLLEAADYCEVTPDDIANGRGQVYLNPVYQTYNGSTVNEETIIDGWVFGLTAMKDAASWSSDTLADLKTYYNLGFKFSIDNVYNVQVVPVDKDGKVLSGAKNQGGTTVGSSFYLSDSKTKLLWKSNYEYSLDYTNQILTKDNVTYKYDHWYYEYDARGDKSSALTKVDYHNTDLLAKFDGPDAEGGTTLTVYIMYEPEEPVTYSAKTIAEKPDKTVLMELKTSEQVTEGKNYQYTIISPKTMNDENDYIYQNNCYLTYVKPDGTNGTILNITSTKYINYKMPAAKVNSTAVFHVVYDKVPVTPIPTPIITASPTPSIPPVVVPEPDSASMPFTPVINAGVLRADLRSTERFVAPLGVPTTESLYGQVTAKVYLLGYNFVKKVGIKYFTVNVSRDYVLKWYSGRAASAGGPELKTETYTATLPISVPRAYGYWEITDLECYKINNALINNYALPGGSITIYPNYTYYSPPAVSVLHSMLEDDHVLPPAEAAAGIVLDPITITPAPGQEINKPVIPDYKEEFTYTALSLTGNAQVKSDYLSFRGATVISNAITETEAPDINISAIPQCYDLTGDNVLYKPDNRIDATKLNGTYPTLGTIMYSQIAGVNSTKPGNIYYPVNGLDNVVIHTPVVCIPTITADNDRYVQMINPKPGCVQLVLDPDPALSDFTVNISNTGFHSGMQGYFTRDFSKSIYDPSVSYISKGNGLLKNQVKFPFDVYIDTGTLYNCNDDDFIKANTWVTIDRSTPRFYLPMTVSEGVYTVNFRTVAVNGEPFLTYTEEYANTQLYNYVATDTMNVEISGRIYGLEVYDLSDYPIWKDVFRIKDSLDLKKDSPDYPDGTPYTSYSSGRSYTYTLGTNDQYGNDSGRNNKFTFPLVNGSHPQYKNIGILKTGYVFRYALETTGNMFSDMCKISIKPNFYYVDKDGDNRVAIDLYYTESINNKTRHLVKVGSSLDQINLKDVKTGDLYLGIPEAELKQTATLRGMNYSEFIEKYSAMFNFSDIRLNWAFRTYTNNAYLNRIKSYPSYSDVTAAGISDGGILERMQRWYGQYYLPNEVHAVAKDFDVMDYADKYGVDYDEDFWLEDGYIIINFTIETVGEDGSRRLSYINYQNYRDNGNCSMWTMENPPLSKTSYKGPIFNFYAGDFIIYYADKRMSDDYETGAIY